MVMTTFQLVYVRCIRKDEEPYRRYLYIRLQVVLCQSSYSVVVISIIRGLPLYVLFVLPNFLCNILTSYLMLLLLLN